MSQNKKNVCVVEVVVRQRKIQLQTAEKMVRIETQLKIKIRCKFYSICYRDVGISKKKQSIPFIFSALLNSTKRFAIKSF